VGSSAGSWRAPRARELIDRTLTHWISFEGALQGYGFTGAASISAGLGRGNEALGHLGRLVRTFIKAATMYNESGPVIETPLSGAQTMHEMLCQSWAARSGSSRPSPTRSAT
jgi:hypothetical protein